MTIVEIILKKDSRAGGGVGVGGGGGGKGAEGQRSRTGETWRCRRKSWGGGGGGWREAEEILQALTRTMPLAKAHPTIADFDVTQLTRKAR